VRSDMSEPSCVNVVQIDKIVVYWTLYSAPVRRR